MSMALVSKQRDAAPVKPLPSVVRQVLNSPGKALDAETRRFFEPRFGHDFSRVRVHSDSTAAESANTVNAQAYTVGNHLVLGAGKGGRHLLTHELTHVAQQADSGEPKAEGDIGWAGQSEEHEAELMSSRILSGQKASVSRRSGGPALATITAGRTGQEHSYG
jgi:hypothetical protein